VGIIPDWKPGTRLLSSSKKNLFLLEKTDQLKSYIKSSKQVGLVAYLKPKTGFDQMVKKSRLNRIDLKRKYSLFKSKAKGVRATYLHL